MAATVKTRQEKFTEVYQKNAWNGTESVSGTGSDHAQTARLRNILPALLRQLGATSLVDAPCGDMHWMKDIPWEQLNIHYTGLDIVAELVEKLSRAYPGRTFQCLDLVTQVPPRADLIFCRDCLVHLPLAEIQTVIGNFAKSGATWLLTTTFPKTAQNTDVRWRRLAASESPGRTPELSRADAIIRRRMHRR